MSTDSLSRWPELDTIFAAALDLDPGDRAAFLQSACGGDAELHEELERLLAAAEASSHFLEDRGTLVERLRQAVRASFAPDLGERIGAYRLVREIGHGGMGVVFLAERADRMFEQHVALKLLAGWVGASTELRRFQRERQILARLRHPNIARLLDGGVAANDRPYFVMDYVDGEPIHRYCDAHGLDVRRRLELFLHVCDAVAFAHRNLVVHRDIKPGNVLVTADGTPKLLDFGIAKMLVEDGGEAADAVTRVGARPMTPECASPEMVRGDPVGTASDVYQLGALLYRLLTGSPPHLLHDHSAAELEHLLATTEVDKPSERVGRPAAPDGSGTSPAQLAYACGSTPERLRRRLHGDLDNIVLTALRKEPERRYRSVEHLADDVRRHLDGRPVRARADTVLYRTSKFVRRHRFGVASGCLAAVFLLGFALAMARQAQRTARERDKAEEVTRFIVDLFHHSDPEQVPGDTLTVRHVLDQGAKRVRTELRDQPEVRATLLGVIGEVYESIGRYAEARPLLEEAVAIRRRVLRPDDPELGSALSQLGELLMDQRNAAAAEPLLQEAVRIDRTSLGDADTLTAGALNDYAYALHIQGRLTEAESLYRSALAIYRRAPHPSVGSTVTLSNLGWILMGRGAYAAADSVFEEALTIRRNAQPTNSAKVANSLSALAYLRNLEGRYVEGESLAREALRIRRALYESPHPAIADALETLGRTLDGQRRFSEAEAAYRESLTMTQATTGSETPDAAMTLSDLSQVLLEMGRLHEAETASRRGLAIYLHSLGPTHPATALAKANLAAVLVREGHYAEAEPLYRDGLRALRAAYPGDHPEVAKVLAAFGRFQFQRGDPAAAEGQLREAVEMLERVVPQRPGLLAGSRASLGECLVALHRYYEAEPLLVQADSALVRLRGEQDPETLRARRALTRVRAVIGRRASAPPRSGG